MAAVARLTWRTAGFEIKLFAAGAIALVVLLAGLVVLLNQTAPPATCLRAVAGTCDRSTFDALIELAGQVMIAMAVLPVLVGSVLGSQVVAREIERGTAQLVWSLSPSRLSWFAERVGLAAAIALLIVVVPAALATVLEGGINRDVDPSLSLLDFGLRGPSVPARTLAVFMVAVVAGLLLGRSIPALMTGAVVGVIVVIAVPAVATALQPTELIAPLGDRQVVYGIVRDERYRAPDGSLISIDEATTRVPAGTLDATTWIEENFVRVAVGVPGRKYWEVEAASTALLLVITAVAAGAGAWIIRTRRPY